MVITELIAIGLLIVFDGQSNSDRVNNSKCKGVILAITIVIVIVIVSVIGIVMVTFSYGKRPFQNSTITD